MHVRVLVFASYADALGSDAVIVEADPGATAGEVLEQVKRRIRVPVPPQPMIAVNAVYASASHVVQPGDEVAIIPPVAGG